MCACVRNAHLIIIFHINHMTTFLQSDWTAILVAVGTSASIHKSPDPKYPAH